MTIASAFNDIVTAQGGTPSRDGTITGALDALNDTLSGSDQQRAETIEEAVRMLGNYIGGGSASVKFAVTCEDGSSHYIDPLPVTVYVNAQEVELTKKTAYGMDYWEGTCKAGDVLSYEFTQGEATNNNVEYFADETSFQMGDTLAEGTIEVNTQSDRVNGGVASNGYTWLLIQGYGE